MNGVAQGRDKGLDPAARRGGGVVGIRNGSGRDRGLHMCAYGGAVRKQCLGIDVERTGCLRCILGLVGSYCQ